MGDEAETTTTLRETPPINRGFLEFRGDHPPNIRHSQRRMFQDSTNYCNLLPCCYKSIMTILKTKHIIFLLIWWWFFCMSLFITVFRNSHHFLNSQLSVIHHQNTIIAHQNWFISIITDLHQPLTNICQYHASRSTIQPWMINKLLDWYWLMMAHGEQPFGLNKK